MVTTAWLQQHGYNSMVTTVRLQQYGYSMVTAANKKLLQPNSEILYVDQRIT